MEENKIPSPAEGEASKNNEGGEKTGRRRRGHRGGKNHKRHRENAQPTDAQKVAEEGENPPAQGGAKPQKKNDQSPKKDDRPSKNGNKGNNNANNSNKDSKDSKDNKDGKKKGDNRSKKNGNSKGERDRHRPDHFQHKDDIYGDPKEEKELADWRAKIVLNAEITPAAPTLSSQKPTEKPINDEPVEIPEGTDLFSSPVLSFSPKADEEKIEVVGIRFRSAGKIYYFDPQGHAVKKGDFAIVETARGPEFGDVCMENTMVNVSETVTPLRPLLRVATPADIAHNEENRQKEREAMPIFQKKIEEHKLDMKLIDVQYAFDNSKLLFYFSSEGRVDFRELVKDLASVFRTRIELRQIGIRDEARMIGGLGACGRPLCCTTFLSDFGQVSMKMAKEQNLSLNSTKISGCCGRLMCCLRYEHETYTEEIKKTPAQGTFVNTPDGPGIVTEIFPLQGEVKVSLRNQSDSAPKRYKREQVEVQVRSPRPERPAEDTAESVSEPESAEEN